MTHEYFEVELDPGDVQWYYSAANTAVQCVSDVPGKADFVKFCDGDSLLLESVYRKNALRYEKEWWRQHDKVMSPRGATESAAAPDEVQADLEPRGPVVRSGYYEADLVTRRVYPIYWPEAPRMIMRGTWFVHSPGQQHALIPLPHSVASRLEDAWQRKKFDSTQMTSNHKPQPDGTYGTRIELEGLLSSSYYAIFTDRNNMFLCTKDSHSVLKTLTHFKSTCARLHRGYDPAVERDPSAKKDQSEQQELSSFEARTVGMAVRHVVLAVHGIGQRMGGRTIADDAQSVRRGVNAMLDDYMPDEIGKGYIQADQVADSIMPEGARSFRQLAHNTCVEVLMYMSPSHAQNILDSVATNLNCTYLRFVRRHGEFSGRISILAYSLGSVLCYDLLAHQPVPQGSAPAQAFQHLAALHRRAQEEHRRWHGAAAAAELGGTGGTLLRPSGEGEGSSNGNGTEPARSRWLSYWGLLKKSGNGSGSLAPSQRQPADVGVARVKSLQSAVSADDPVVAILDEAAASMQAGAAMWQVHTRRCGASEDEPNLPEDGTTLVQGSRAAATQEQVHDTRKAHQGFPPQQWLGKLARKLAQVRSKGRQSEPAQDAGAAQEPEPPATQDGNTEVGAAVTRQASTGGEGGRPQWSPAGAATGPASPQPRQENAADPMQGLKRAPQASAQEAAEGTSSRRPCQGGPANPAAALGNAGPGSAFDGGVLGGNAPGHALRSSGLAASAEGNTGQLDAGRQSASGGAAPPPSDLPCQALSDDGDGAESAAEAAEHVQLQQQLDALHAQAAATAAQISQLQARLAQPSARKLFMETGHSSGGAQGDAARVQRCDPHLCLPAEAPHSMAPEQSMGLPSEAGAFHAYGMGQVGEPVEAAGPEQEQRDADDGREHAASLLGSPSAERIAQARMLWPGSTLHELDAKEQQPLTMQSLRYPELCFLVDNFIMIGSPVGLFAALQGVNPAKGRPLGSPAAGMLYPGSGPGGLPVCRRMFNVFHPFDPVAYRLEPLIQKDGCPRPQLVPYHRGGRKLKMNIVDAGENVAKTMDKVAAAFTFSFRRSKEALSAPAAEQVDYRQCSVAPYLLGLPLLTALPQEELPRVPSGLPGAPIPAAHRSVASGEVTVRSAPEAWRAADSPRCMTSCPPRLSSSSETLVRIIPDLADDTDAGSILSCTVDAPPAAAPDSPGAHALHQPHAPTRHPSSLLRVSHSSVALQALQHAAPAPVGRAGTATCDGGSRPAMVTGVGPVVDSAAARVVRSAADAAAKKGRRVLAGAGQGGFCAQGQGGSVGRLDFQLQEDFVETQFFGAFRAHFCYWKHEDVALLVCRAACGYDVVDGTQEQAVPASSAAVE